MKFIGQYIQSFIARFRNDVYLEDIDTGTIASGGNLGLDSNNKIVKAAEATGDLTSIVAGKGLSGTSLTGPIPTLNLAINELDTALPTSGDFLATLDANASTHQKTTTDSLAALFAGDGLTATEASISVDASQSAITTLAGLTSLGAAGATTSIAAGDVTMYNAVNDGNPTISLGSSATNRFEIKTGYNSGAQTLDEVYFNSYTTSGTTNDGRYIFQVDEVEIGRFLDSGISWQGAISCKGTILNSNPTASSATEGGKLQLQADDGAAMGDDHRLGVIEFKGAEDASATRSIGARIQAICRDAWDGSNNDADLEFYTTDGTTESKVLTLDADKLATFTGAVAVTAALTADSIDIDDGGADINGTLEANTITIGGTNIMTGSLLTTAGTISAGVWNGTAIAHAYIGADAIDGDNIADDSVNSEHYVDGSIDTAHIADDQVTFAKASGVTPNVFGSVIKLIPSDFGVNDDGGNTKFGVGYVETAGSSYGMRSPNSNAELFAFVSIPEGMKATHVNIHAKSTYSTEVFEAQINATTMSSKGTGNCNTNLALSSEVESSATNFLAIMVSITATTDKVYGGTVTIAAI